MPKIFFYKKPHWVTSVLKSSQQVPYSTSHLNIINIKRLHCCYYNKFEIDFVSTIPTIFANEIDKLYPAQQKKKQINIIFGCHTNVTDVYNCSAKSSSLYYPSTYKLVYKPKIMMFDFSSLNQNFTNLPINDENHLLLSQNNGLAKNNYAISSHKAKLLVSFSTTRSTSNNTENERGNKLKCLADNLQSELPLFLSSATNWHNFERYTEDVKLKVVIHKMKEKKINSEIRSNTKNISTVSFRGLENYKKVLQAYRYWNRKYLKNGTFEIIAINRYENQSLVEVKWRIVGYTPINVISSILMKFSSLPTYFDYVSLFHMNEDGLIYCHEVENVLRFRDSNSEISWKTTLSEFIKSKSGVGV